MSGVMLIECRLDVIADTTMSLERTHTGGRVGNDAVAAAAAVVGVLQDRYGSTSSSVMSGKPGLARLSIKPLIVECTSGRDDDVSADMTII